MSTKIKKRVIRLVVCISICFAIPACQSDTGNVPVSQEVSQENVKLEAPTASLPSGTYSNEERGKRVTLRCATEGAEIYYSVNGSAYKLYEMYRSVILIDTDTELSVFAKLTGRKSEVVRYEYKFGAEPEVSAEPDVQDTEQTQETVFDNNIVSDSILNDFTKKYYYQQLDDDQKKIYKIMYEGIKSRKECISFEGLTAYDWSVGTVFQLVRFENPQFFWMYDEYSWDTYEDEQGNIRVNSIWPTYSYTEQECKKMQSEIEKKIQEYRRKLAGYSDKYEIALAIHDEIVNGTDYDEEYYLRENQNDFNIYGVFVDNLAVCQGYANAFSYLCQLMGMQCVNVNGKVSATPDSTEWHEWNRLCIDGTWCNVDATWDDPVYNDNSQILLHDYFCITDKVLEMDHIQAEWFPFGEKQKATDESMTYFAKKGLPYYIDSDEAYNGLIEETVKNYKKGIYHTEIYCHSSLCISQLYDRILKNTNAFIREFEKRNLSFSNSYYGYDGNKFSYTLVK